MRWSWFFVLFVLVLVCSNHCIAHVDISAYSMQPKSQQLQQQNVRFFDSLVQKATATAKKVYQVNIPLNRPNQTLEFYLMLFLCFFLGLMRAAHPKFFSDLWRSFINPTLGGRQLKDVIQSASFTNLLMNLFSSVVLGLYVYYMISWNVDSSQHAIPQGLLVALMVMAAVLVFSVKYVFVQITAWAFNEKQNGDQYNYNVFLVNKILSMFLLPLVICLAFATPKLQSWAALLSFVFLLIAYMVRYVRSWPIYDQTFQNSRFHFFMYLCAFEILPMAVFIKGIVLLF